MNKLILITIAVLLVVAVAGSVYYFGFYNSEETTSYVIPKVLEPYIRIKKNEEMSSQNLTLNSQNKEWYYYFDIYNYDDSIDEYNELEIIPYVKIGINQDDGSTTVPSYININLYYLKDLSLGMEESNIEEITTKGEANTNFQDYFECKKLPKYNKDEENQNIAHYVAKISLNTENEDYTNLSYNISQKLEIILGYKK